MSQNTNVRAIETGKKSSIWQAFLTHFETNANKMNCELMLTYDTPAYMFNVYKNQPSRQTGIGWVQKRFPQNEVPIYICSL